MSKLTLSQIRKARPAFDAGLREGAYAREGAALVRGFREERGWTQKQLAAALGVSQARVSTAEKGAGRDGPSYAFIKRVAAACGVEWPAQAAEPAPSTEDEEYNPPFAAAGDNPAPARGGRHLDLTHYVAKIEGEFSRQELRMLDELIVDYDPTLANLHHVYIGRETFIPLRRLMHSKDLLHGRENTSDTLRYVVLQMMLLLGAQQGNDPSKRLDPARARGLIRWLARTKPR